jgi:hypothetical protein
MHVFKETFGVLITDAKGLEVNEIIWSCTHCESYVVFAKH